MSSDLDKFLAKVNKKEKLILGDIIEKIIGKNLSGMDTKKLAGYDNVFRLRKGKFRIIFETTKTDNKIISIGKRSDTTYKF